MVVHLIGAFFAFGMGLVYCCLQTYLSFKLPDIPGSSRNLRVGRLIICILDAVFILTRILAVLVHTFFLVLADEPKRIRQFLKTF